MIGFVINDIDLKITRKSRPHKKRAQQFPKSNEFDKRLSQVYNMCTVGENKDDKRARTLKRREPATACSSFIR